MKQILTHKARSVPDVIELLKTGGTFSCPNLPHYRYRQTQQSRHILQKSGMLKVSGKTDVGTNYVASDKFKTWLDEYSTGLTKLMPIKWAKSMKDAKP
jgi:hypothetical protein